MINEFQKPFSKEGEKNFERIFGRAAPKREKQFGFLLEAELRSARRQEREDRTREAE